MTLEIFIPLSLLIIAFLYSAVGHGGASGYSAILALYGIAGPSLKPAILILNIAVSLIGFSRFSIEKKVNFKILIPLLIISIPCAYIGGRIHISKELLEKFIGIALLLSALITILNETVFKKQLDTEVIIPKLPITMGTGSVLGFLAGVTGIGGGVFLSPLMLHFKWAKIKEISGVASGFILFNSIAGLMGQLSHNISLPENYYLWVIAVIFGGFFGSFVGSKKLDGKPLRLWLSFIVLTASIKLLF